MSRPSARRRSRAIIDRELKNHEVYTGTVFVLLRRLWSDYLSKRKGQLCLGLVAAVAGAGIHLCFPMTIRYLIDNVLMPGNFGDPELVHQRMGGVLIYLALNTGVWIISLSSQWIRSSTILALGQWLVFSVRRDLNEKLHNLHIGFFERTPAGRIMSRLLDDVDMMRHWVTGQLIDFVGGITRLLIGTALAFYLNWKIALIVLAVMPLYALTIYWLRPRVRRANITMRRLNATMYARASERIGGIPVIRANSSERREVRGFAAIVHDYVRVGSRMVVYNQGMGFAAAAISAVATGIVIWFAALSVRDGQMTVGDLIAFIRLLNHMFDPIAQLTTIFIQFQAMLVVLNRVFNLLDEKIEVVSGTQSIQTIEWPIVLRDVSLTYPSSQTPALNKISLQIAHGQRIAVMGPSGCGKSSLLGLLLRFYDPSSGTILLGKQALDTLDIQSVRKHICMVQQEPFVFSGTIRSNILYGHQDATDEQMEKAARFAELHDFIISLPDGYNTAVGEKGISLSGGQKQRLALATALLTDPELLLLDDITSSLDAQTEAHIQATLNRSLAHRTAIIVTQRIALAQSCDRIVILDDGKIEAIGTHAELIERDGFYRTICEKQGWI